MNHVIVVVIYKTKFIACECNPLGSLNDNCDVISGNCTCKNNYGGRTCSICEDGYYNYPLCTCEYIQQIMISKNMRQI